jgi:predicted ribosomally synthesized peptide with nif11-like leader
MVDAGRVTALIRTIAADDGLRERLATASDADRAAIVAELGFGDVTAADVHAHAASFVPAVAAELDDSELDAVAGGGDTDTTATTTTTTLIASASAAAAV